MRRWTRWSQPWRARWKREGDAFVRIREGAAGVAGCLGLGLGLGLVLTCAVTLALAANPVSDGTRELLSGTVSKVVDGDTIEVQLGRRHVRVHLNGVDAPEIGQPWGKEASAALAQLVLNQHVDLQPVGNPHTSRMTAVVFVGEEEVGATLVGNGDAWADRQDLRRSDSGLCETEARARDAKLGLWALPRAQRVAPWEYRHRLLHPHHIDYSQETAEHCKASVHR